MTWIDVTDSAIKIGLGALIGAAATLTGISLQASHQRETDRRKKRSDLIEKLAAEFEESHQVMVELYSGYATCLDASNPLVAQISWGAIQKCMIEKVRPAFAKFIGHEGRLMLIGASDAVKKLNGYRIAATALQNEVRMIGGSEGAPVTPESWSELSQAVVLKRTAFFEALRREYEKV